MRGRDPKTRVEGVSGEGVAGEGVNFLDKEPTSVVLKSGDVESVREDVEAKVEQGL